MPRVLFIGERVNDRSLAPSTVSRWAKKWEENPLGFIRTTPAMTLNGARERLMALTGLEEAEFRIVNLMPPDREPGTWDRVDARYYAGAVCNWLCGGEHEFERVVLLGTKVAAAFSASVDAELVLGGVGTMSATVGDRELPTMLFPHPSGRNRFWNSADDAAEMRSKLQEFLS